jgi:hypothetical protein
VDMQLSVEHQLTHIEPLSYVTLDPLNLSYARSDRTGSEQQSTILTELQQDLLRERYSRKTGFFGKLRAKVSGKPDFSGPLKNFCSPGVQTVSLYVGRVS